MQHVRGGELMDLYICRAIDGHWGSWRLYNRNQAFWASSDGKTSHPCASLCSDQDTEKKEMRVRKVSQSELARWCICGPKGAVLNVL